MIADVDLSHTIWQGTLREIDDAFTSSNVNAPLDGSSPLAIAVLRARPDVAVVRALVGKGAAPDVILANGRTLYEEAKAQGVDQDIMHVLGKSELHDSLEAKLVPRDTPSSGPYEGKI